MRSAWRQSAAAVLLALAALAAGCTSRNVVYEELQQPFNRVDVRDTQVRAAAELTGDTLRMVAAGDNYYYYYRYYDPYYFYPPFYGRWYYEPATAEPFYYEIFLNVEVRGFPARGVTEQTPLPPDGVTVVFGRLDRGTILTRARMAVASAVGWWDKDRPVLKLDAAYEPGGDVEFRERRDDEFGAVQSKGVSVLVPGLRLRTTLDGPISSERFFQITHRWDELKIGSLMAIGP